MAWKSNKTNEEILDSILNNIPPMRDEHNQKEIDAEQRRIFLETVAQRKAVDDIERSLRSG